MNFTTKTTLVVFFITVFCSAKQFKLHDHEQRKYLLQSDKKELFKFVGCQYLNFVKRADVEFNKIDPTKTQWYLHYWTINQEFVQKYYHDIMHYRLAPMYVRWISSDMGYGVFANRDIAKDEFLGVCAGEVRSMLDENRKLIQNYTYIWEFPFQTCDGARFCVDGRRFGNEIRFINHNDRDPNAKHIYVLIDGFVYTCYVAMQNIAKDSEITSSYGDGPWVEDDFE